MGFPWCPESCTLLILLDPSEGQSLGPNGDGKNPSIPATISIKKKNDFLRQTQCLGQIHNTLPLGRTLILHKIMFCMECVNVRTLTGRWCVKSHCPKAKLLGDTTEHRNNRPRFSAFQNPKATHLNVCVHMCV